MGTWKKKKEVRERFKRGSKKILAEVVMFINLSVTEDYMGIFIVKHVTLYTLYIVHQLHFIKDVLKYSTKNRHAIKNDVTSYLKKSFCCREYNGNNICIVETSFGYQSLRVLFSAY